MKLKKLVEFSTFNRRGAIILLALTIVILANVILTSNPEVPVSGKLPVESKTYHGNFHKRYQKKHFEDKGTGRKIRTFAFDPNTLPVDSFVIMGLSQKQAMVIENYRKKGGKFRTPEDFARMYVITKSFFDKQKKYIHINQGVRGNLKKNRVIPRVELNTVTMEELIALPLIGEKRAQAIITFRNKAGGIYSVKQLAKMRIMDECSIDTLMKYSDVDESRIVKLDVNTATFTEMKSHPLLGYFVTKKITGYKNLVGTIKRVDELY